MANPPPVSGLRVLFLEDDPLDGELVTHALRQTNPAVTVLLVDSGIEFVRALDTFAPDVILSDHAVAQFDAWDALRLAQARRPESPFLLVAGEFQPVISRCLKAGAADFIPKAELERLGPAIQAAVAQLAPLRTMTERQRQVLQLLASGYSTREIGRRLRLSVKTIETHRAHVMARLDIHDFAGLVRYALQVGIVTPKPTRT